MKTQAAPASVLFINHLPSPDFCRQKRQGALHALPLAYAITGSALLVSKPVNGQKLSKKERALLHFTAARRISSQVRAEKRAVTRVQVIAIRGNVPKHS